MIVNIDNQKIIDKLMTILRSGQEDFWFELSEKERQEIKLGIEQLDDGQRISLDDFLINT